MKLFLTFALVAALWSAPPLAAQKVFDVVSVKPNVSASGPSDPIISPQRFSWINVRLRQLIQVGYEVRPYQLIGLPDWADSARFDVTATVNFPASRQEMNTMLQSVLADRFDLVAHRDTRDLPVYALVPARADGRLGPNIHPAAVDCEAVNAKPLDSAGAQSAVAACSPQLGLTKLKATGFHMSGLAGGLMRILDRTVIDKTGVTGAFDLELSWTPDPTMLPNGVPAPTNSTAPSIFATLQEQLGLRLISDRGSVDVLVIDRINRPKPD
jgi:uncharacterized protein (TIGR03435 family)